MKTKLLTPLLLIILIGMGSLLSPPRAYAQSGVSAYVCSNTDSGGSCWWSSWGDAYNYIYNLYNVGGSEYECSDPSNPDTCQPTNEVTAANTDNYGYLNYVSCANGGGWISVDYFYACTSAPNDCGQTQDGTIDGNDPNLSCSAGPPGDPSGYGSGCSSSPNACGQTNNGTIQCDGSCSAGGPPANPGNYGQGCNSAPNACGQTNSGSIQCNGSCSAGTPGNPSGYGSSCTSSPNACGQTQANGTIQCDGSCSSTPPSNSGCAVNGACASGHYSCSAGSSASNVNGTYSWTWSCAGSNGGTTASCSEAKSLPDLTAGAVSPTSASAGSATTFSATISNIGSGSTGAGFTNLFQAATDANGSGASDIGTSAMSTLGANGNSSASLSYTFPPGDIGTTQYLRVCADKSSAGDSGSITESNENNNCGPWTAVAVVGSCYGQGCSPYGCPPGVGCTSCVYSWSGQPSANPAQCCSLTPGVCPSLPTATLSASPSIISLGQSSSLTWSSANATSCTSAGGFSTGGATSNNSGVSVSPSTTSNYQISCTGPGGTASSNIATITVQQPNAYITASPIRVASGSSSNVSWSASNVVSCTVTGTDGYSSGTLLGPTIASTTVSRTISSQTTYTLSCSGPSVSSSVIVNVVSGFQEF